MSHLYVQTTPEEFAIIKNKKWGVHIYKCNSLNSGCDLEYLYDNREAINSMSCSKNNFYVNILIFSIF